MKRKKHNLFNFCNKKQKYNYNIELLIQLFKKLNITSKCYNNKFKKYCYNILPNKYKFSNKSLKLLKFLCYDYLIRLFQLSNVFKKHRNRKTLIVNDLLLANYFIKT